MASKNQVDLLDLWSFNLISSHLNLYLICDASDSVFSSLYFEFKNASIKQDYYIEINVNLRV